MKNLKAKIKRLLIDNPGCRNKASEVVKLIHNQELSAQGFNRYDLYHALENGKIHQADTIKRYYRQVKSELRLEHPEWFEDTREQEDTVKEDLGYTIKPLYERNDPTDYWP